MKHVTLVVQSRKQIIIKKISEIKQKITDVTHDKCIITSEFNKLTGETFAARLEKVSLVTQTDFETKLISVNKKNRLRQEKT